MNAAQFLTWLGTKQLCRKPLIMGVVNATPDSFFDAGRFASTAALVAHAVDLIAQGADIIDIGGESTRPGAVVVPVDCELTRVIPVIEKIRKTSDCCIAIDTYKPEVMQAAVAAGADIINDTYALQWDGALEMAARLAVPVSLMHMQGQPLTMQTNPQYPSGVTHEVNLFFEKRLFACHEAGIAPDNLMLDPGFGFGKTVQNNLQLVKQLQAFKTWGCPLLLGVSRKSTVGALLDKDVHGRLIGSIAMGLYAVLHGADILRVHDVAQTKEAFKILEAIEEVV